MPLSLSRVSTLAIRNTSHTYPRAKSQKRVGKRYGKELMFGMRTTSYSLKCLMKESGLTCTSGLLSQKERSISVTFTQPKTRKKIKERNQLRKLEFRVKSRQKKRNQYSFLKIRTLSLMVEIRIKTSPILMCNLNKIHSKSKMKTQPIKHNVNTKLTS